MMSNVMAGINLKQPTSLEERTGVAEKCCKALKMTMPLLVDEMTDIVGHSYSGMPDRLYVVSKDGHIVYKGGRGPFGFKSGELEQSLLLLLMDDEVKQKSTVEKK
jgi:hypothetical protein